MALAEAVGPSGTVCGIDLSQGMFEIARTRVDKAGLSERVALLRGDAVELPYEQDRFDRVFISFTLKLFDTPEIPTVLAECRRVLRDRGRICVVAMSKESGSNVMIRLYEWFHRRLPGVFGMIRAEVIPTFYLTSSRNQKQNAHGVAQVL